jgi:hypothetical protein
VQVVDTYHVLHLKKVAPNRAEVETVRSALEKDPA